MTKGHSDSSLNGNVKNYNPNPLLNKDLLSKIANYLPKKDLENLELVNKFLLGEVESKFVMKIDQGNFKEYFEESPAAGSKIFFPQKSQHRSLKLSDLTFDQIEKIINAVEFENDKIPNSEKFFAIKEIEEFAGDIPEGFQSILSKLPELIKVNFSGKKIGKKRAQILAEFLKVSKAIKTFYLDDNEIRNEGAVALAKALEINETLKFLHIRKNEIGNEGAKALAEILKTNKTLTSFAIDGNQIGNEGFTALAKALQTNKTLIDFSFGGLEGFQIGNEGAFALAEVLKVNQTLTDLTLFYNKIESEGIKVLAEALKTNKTLTYIDLFYNGVGNEGAKFLAEALKTNGALNILELERCEIGIQGAKALAEALKTNKTLNTLNLENNQIGDGGAKDLAEALKTNKTLTRLNLYETQIGNDGAKAIAEALKLNTTLTEFKIWNSQITDEAIYEQIVSALERNIKIAEFLEKSPAVYNKKDLLEIINLIVRENEGANKNQEVFKENLIKLFDKQPNKQFLLKLLNELSEELELKKETKNSVINVLKDLVVEVKKTPDIEISSKPSLQIKLSEIEVLNKTDLAQELPRDKNLQLPPSNSPSSVSQSANLQQNQPFKQPEKR